MQLSVNYEWWKCLKQGTKVVEGRLGNIIARPGFASLRPGATLTFSVAKDANGIQITANAGQEQEHELVHSLDMTVDRLCHYASFRDMLEAETLARVLPGVASLDDGVAVYRRFYPATAEKEHGVLAITLAPSPTIKMTITVTNTTTTTTQAPSQPPVCSKEEDDKRLTGPVCPNVR
jgi:ASC-1-like (ASCH) protein